MSIPKVSNLSPADQLALDGELEIGNRICLRYLGDNSTRDLRSLDFVLDSWLEDTSSTRPSANDAALGLGSMFGELLRTRYGCRWVLIADEYGCDLGMTHDDTGWQFFPRHSVKKRLEPENAGKGVLSSLAATLEAEGYFGSV